MSKKTYIVKCKYIFEGEYFVKARDKKQAKEYVDKHCGLVIGGNLHTSLPDDEIDWKFNVHPTQKIIK